MSYENELDKFKNNIPQDMDDNPHEYVATMFETSTCIGKFYKRDKLSEQEHRQFSKKLSEEFEKDVLEPYMKLLSNFCEKYEVAPVTQALKSYQCNDMQMLAMEQSLRHQMEKLFSK